MNKDKGPQPSLSFKETKILLDPSSRKKSLIRACQLQSFVFFK